MARLTTNLVAFFTVVGAIWFLACTIPLFTSLTVAIADKSDRVGNSITGIRLREVLADWMGSDLRVEQPPRTLRPVLVNPTPRPAVVIVQPPAVAPANLGGTCGTVIDDHPPVVSQYWKVPGDGSWRIINFWTNEPGQDQQEHKLLLEPGKVELRGGGKAWGFCNKQDAEVNFVTNRFPAVTLQQLRQQGLAR